MPESNDGNLLARFHLGLRSETAAEDILLFQAIPQRHTHRGPFLEQPVNDGVPMSVAGYKSWLSFAGRTLVRSFDHGDALANTDYELALKSPVLALLSTNNDDAPAWMSAGQALQRVLLDAGLEGVWAAFLNPPLEVAELRSYLAENTACSGYPQVLLRMGYGPEPAPTPRRDVRQFLIPH